MAGARSEHDSLGEVAVPETAYWGAQTARAVMNFPISGVSLAHYPALLRALAMVKQAAARANLALGKLAPEKARAIEAACAEIIAGKLHDQFPVDVIQGGCWHFHQHEHERGAGQSRARTPRPSARRLSRAPPQ